MDYIPNRAALRRARISATGTEQTCSQVPRTSGAEGITARWVSEEIENISRCSMATGLQFAVGRQQGGCEKVLPSRTGILALRRWQGADL